MSLLQVLLSKLLLYEVDLGGCCLLHQSQQVLACSIDMCCFAPPHLLQCEWPELAFFG